MGKEESELPVALKVDERQDTSKTQQSEGGERERIERVSEMIL